MHNLSTVLQKLKIKETNVSMKSARSEMQLILSKLIKLCDQQSLCDSATTCSGWTEENVCAVVDATFSAIEVSSSFTNYRFNCNSYKYKLNISESVESCKGTSYQ
jgi:hypothetical protein